MASNGDWGTAAEADDDLAAAWDSYARIPGAGTNAALDRLCEAKSITIESLIRQGAKLADHDTIAFMYNHGIKYRRLSDGKRWAFAGSEFRSLKIVPAQTPGASRVVVVESETDAAWLSDRLDEVDVAILPAGAKRVTPQYASQLLDYEIVMFGLDNDEAGDAGVRKLREHLPSGVDYRPPDGSNDWCELGTADPPPPPTEAPPNRIIVAAGDMLAMPEPDVTSWLSESVLPIGGYAMLHGWAKSFKTFLAIDMMAALAQGTEWAGFKAVEEPTDVLVVQYELTWPYYRARIDELSQNAAEPELFDKHFHTFTPLTRPALIAGDKKQEDFLLAQAEQAGIQIILIDPIRRASRGANLNDEAEVAKMLAFIERLQDHGITVITTHHDNKDAARHGSGDPLGMTGSGAFTGDPDTLISIGLPKGDRWTESTRRNMNILLRNGPAPEPRSFEMTDHGIQYHEGIFGYGDLTDDEDGPDL